MAGLRIGRQYMERDDKMSWTVTNGGTSWPVERLIPVLYSLVTIRQDTLAVMLLNSVKLSSRIECLFLNRLYAMSHYIICEMENCERSGLTLL